MTDRPSLGDHYGCEKERRFTSQTRTEVPPDWGTGRFPVKPMSPRSGRSRACRARPTPSCFAHCRQARWPMRTRVLALVLPASSRRAKAGEMSSERLRSGQAGHSARCATVAMQATVFGWFPRRCDDDKSVWECS